MSSLILLPFQFFIDKARSGSHGFNKSHATLYLLKAKSSRMWRTKVLDPQQVSWGRCLWTWGNNSTHLPLSFRRNSDKQRSSLCGRFTTRPAFYSRSCRWGRQVVWEVIASSKNWANLKVILRKEWIAKFKASSPFQFMIVKWTSTRKLISQSTAPQFHPSSRLHWSWYSPASLAKCWNTGGGLKRQGTSRDLTSVCNNILSPPRFNYSGPKDNTTQALAISRVFSE